MYVTLFRVIYNSLLINVIYSLYIRLIRVVLLVLLAYEKYTVAPRIPDGEEIVMDLQCIQYH